MTTSKLKYYVVTIHGRKVYTWREWIRLSKETRAKLGDNVIFRAYTKRNAALLMDELDRQMSNLGIMRYAR